MTLGVTADEIVNELTEKGGTAVRLSAGCQQRRPCEPQPPEVTVTHELNLPIL